MNAPQIIVLCWFGLRLVCAAAIDGKSTAPYFASRPTWRFSTTIVNVAIAGGILYWGGFWSHA